MRRTHIVLTLKRARHDYLRRAAFRAGYYQRHHFFSPAIFHGLESMSQVIHIFIAFIYPLRRGRHTISPILASHSNAYFSHDI